MSKNTDMMILFNKGDFNQKTEIDTLKARSDFACCNLRKNTVNEIHRL